MRMKFWMAFAVLALTACTTTFDSNKVDYKSQGKQVPTLEVPPDLAMLSKNAQASVPAGGAANANSFQTSGLVVPTTTAGVIGASRLGDTRVVRDGTQRWLVSDRPPEKLWDEIKKFWSDNGLTIVVDQPNLGIMETDWNENRAKLPQDGFRKLLGKVLDGLYSTNERDKYRTRLESTSGGGTEIYISHRGMMEDYVNKNNTTLVWRPRPADPELEVEFLKRLMVRLGAAQESANAALDPPLKGVPALPVQAITRASIEQDAAQSSLILNDTFDQAWRRVGLSLDRTNFTVEDRDRSKGIYFVRYIELDAGKNDPGFFAKMFGAKSKESLQKYQIILSPESTKTRVRVADTAGVVLNTADTKSILKVLLEDLK